MVEKKKRIMVLVSFTPALNSEFFVLYKELTCTDTYRTFAMLLVAY